MADEPEPHPRHQAFPARFFAKEIRAWNGNSPLAGVFWVQGVLTSIALMVLYATTVLLQQTMAEQILLLAAACYTFWILVAIWRCSLASDTLWAMLARFLTIAWALNIALVLFFRQMDLLAGFAGLAGNGLSTGF